MSLKFTAVAGATSQTTVELVSGTLQVKPGCCYYMTYGCNSKCFDTNQQSLHELGYRFRSAGADEVDGIFTYTSVYSDVKMGHLQNCKAPYTSEWCPRSNLLDLSSKTPVANRFLTLNNLKEVNSAHVNPVLSSSLLQVVNTSGVLTNSMVILAQNSWLEMWGSRLSFAKSTYVHQNFALSTIRNSDWTISSGAAIHKDILLGIYSSNYTLDLSSFIFGKTLNALPTSPSLASLKPAMLVKDSKFKAKRSGMLIQNANEVFFRNSSLILDGTTLTISNSNVFLFDSTLSLRNAKVVLRNSNLWLYNTQVEGDKLVADGPVRSISSTVTMEAAMTATLQLSTQTVSDNA